MLDTGSMYETMSISTGLYPNLNLWNANKLHYITLHYWSRIPHPSLINIYFFP